MSDRFTRQERLAEIGPTGQARLREGVALVADGPDAELAALYLERAGVGSVARSDEPARPFAHAAAFRHAEPARVGSAAWRALRELLRLLERVPT
jgi:hypothetical protein